MRQISFFIALILLLISCGEKPDESRTCQRGSYFFSRQFERERNTIATVYKYVISQSDYLADSTQRGTQISYRVDDVQSALSYKMVYKDAMFVRCVDTTDVILYYDKFGKLVGPYNYNESNPFVH